jgi:hypothetical protein
VKDVLYVPKIIPDKDEECLLMLRAVMELLLKT